MLIDRRDFMLAASSIGIDGISGGNIDGISSIGGPWNPSMLPGLLAWYKADAGTFSNTSGTTPAGNGQNVLFWKDQSSNHFDLTNTSGPVLNANTLNSLPTLSFNAASSQFLQSAANIIPLSGNTSSIFGVIRIIGTGGARIFSFVASGQSFDFNNTLSYSLYEANATVVDITRGGDVGLSRNFPDSTWVQLGCILNGATGTIYLNNAPGSANASTGAFGPTGNFAVGALAVSPSNFFNGSIAEVVFTSSALTSGDLMNINKYFMNKWGV